MVFFPLFVHCLIWRIMNIQILPTPSPPPKICVRICKVNAWINFLWLNTQEENLKKANLVIYHICEMLGSYFVFCVCVNNFDGSFAYSKGQGDNICLLEDWHGLSFSKLDIQASVIVPTLLMNSFWTASERVGDTGRLLQLPSWKI